MRRDGFWGNVGIWTVLFVILCLVGACAGLKGPQIGGSGNGVTVVTRTGDDYPYQDPPDEPMIIVERPPQRPTEEREARPELRPVENPVVVEETTPTTTPTTPSSTPSTPAVKPDSRPSARPGTGNKPAPQDIPVDEPAAEEPASSFNADEYTAVLDVTSQMELHQKGDLRVWIGIENYKETHNMPEVEVDMARKTTTFPGDEGNYARITPYAPDFRIEPEESQIMRIVPSGSSVLFTIIPEKKGEFKISAKIELYDNPDFEGVPIPKTTNIVSVVVSVDPTVNLKSGLGQMGTVLWDNFLKFWGAIVALIFGAILFVTRKYIKKKTGFKGNGIESSSLSEEGEAAPTEATETPGNAGSESGEDAGDTEPGDDDDGPDWFDVGEGGE